MNIFIKDLNDAPVKALEKFDQAKPLHFDDVLIVGHATEQGRTGVCLYFTDPGGQTYFTTVSARIIANGITAAIRGAASKFGDNLNEA